MANKKKKNKGIIESLLEKADKKLLERSRKKRCSCYSRNDGKCSK